MPYPNPAGAVEPARGRARWERYKLTRPFSPRDLAALWGSIAGVVLLAVLLGWALGMKGGVVTVAAIPFLAAWFDSRRILFQLDATGVRMGNATLPWTDVTQFVVATPPGDEVALIGTRLRAETNLPAAVRLPQPHPAMPTALYVTVPGHRFDLDTMVSKARKHAPSPRRIVVAEPTGERVAS